MFAHVEKTLTDLGVKYDMEKMMTGKALGDGYFFVYAKSKSRKKDSDFGWAQSSFNFPLSAIAGTLDNVAMATIKLDLLTLFAQNLGRQFQDKYGKDFAEAIMLEFYDFLSKHFGDEKQNPEMAEKG